MRVMMPLASGLILILAATTGRAHTLAESSRGLILACHAPIANGYLQVNLHATGPEGRLSAVIVENENRRPPQPQIRRALTELKATQGASTMKFTGERFALQVAKTADATDRHPALLKSDVYSGKLICAGPSY